MSKKSKIKQNIKAEETELEIKNKKVMDLVETIKLYDRHLVSKDKLARILDLSGRLEFQLGELLKEVQLREADLKISNFQKVLNILKEENIV